METGRDQTIAPHLAFNGGKRSLAEHRGTKKKDKRNASPKDFFSFEWRGVEEQEGREEQLASNQQDG
jgi:hypothetical protein